MLNSSGVLIVLRISSEYVGIYVMQHVSRSTEGIGASVQFDTLKKITECERLEQEKPETSDDDSVVSRIEQLMKGKAFSR